MLQLLTKPEVTTDKGDRGQVSNEHEKRISRTPHICKYLPSVPHTHSSSSKAGSSHHPDRLSPLSSSISLGEEGGGELGTMKKKKMKKNRFASGCIVRFERPAAAAVGWSVAWMARMEWKPTESSTHCLSDIGDSFSKTPTYFSIGSDC